MNLDELAVLGRRREARRLEIKALEDLQEADDALLLAELGRRGLTEKEHAGVKVAKQTKRYGYFVDVLKSRLKPAVFRRVRIDAVDGKALARELKAGNLTAADMEAAEKRSEPWVVVTIVEQEAKAA